MSLHVAAATICTLPRKFKCCGLIWKFHKWACKSKLGNGILNSGRKRKHTGSLSLHLLSLFYMSVWNVNCFYGIQFIDDGENETRVKSKFIQTATSTTATAEKMLHWNMNAVLRMTRDKLQEKWALFLLWFINVCVLNHIKTDIYT